MLRLNGTSTVGRCLLGRAAIIHMYKKHHTKNLLLASFIWSASRSERIVKSRIRSQTWTFCPYYLPQCCATASIPAVRRTTANASIAADSVRLLPFFSMNLFLLLANACGVMMLIQKHTLTADAVCSYSSSRRSRRPHVLTQTVCPLPRPPSPHPAPPMFPATASTPRSSHDPQRCY